MVDSGKVESGALADGRLLISLSVITVLTEYRERIRLMSPVAGKRMPLSKHLECVIKFPQAAVGLEKCRGPLTHR